MRPVTATGQNEAGPVLSADAWPAAITSTSPARPSRSAGCLARHAAASSRSPPGSSASVGGACTTRYSMEAGGPSPKAPAPVAANTITQPSENTSVAGPARPPSACSGDMNDGVPTICPVEVTAVRSSAREMPKSITRGPSMASSTLAGFRSRCTRPQACTACSASTRPAASFHTAATGSGPASATAAASDGPGTNTVASHGGSSSGPAAVTGAV